VTAGSDALRDAYATLHWAASRHDEMLRVFAEFARPGGGDDRPYGIRFHTRGRPAGLVVASFIVEEPMPGEMSLLAADLVHNARVALDHIAARLKDHFGGNPRQGGFPVCKTEEIWKQRVVDRGRNSPLHGLDQVAVDLIYAEQPLHQQEPEADPLVVVNRLDNDDKHELLHPAFVYTDVSQGLDLLEIVDPARVIGSTNEWLPGQPLEDGSKIATFMVRGEAQGVIKARHDARLGFATGDVGSDRASFTGMIDRVRGIADKAAQLVDSKGDGRT
jgi:hypothetical protein